MKQIPVLILLILSIPALAQERFTLSGYVKDSASGESLIGATITIKDLGRGVSSNAYGYYSITLPRGRYRISCSFVGYISQEKEVLLEENLQMDFLQAPRGAVSSEVVVYSRRRDANVKNAQMGRIDLSISQAKNLPSFMGEVDILKTIQLLPGVRNAGEGNAGFYVRGGGPDQNLIILDDAVVYNTGHLFGFFSIFNADAIKNASLIKGGMPAQYGGRLSSVLDISMKDGNAKKLQMEGGIGLIASRFSVQGPLKKDKASFIISARRTYIDALVKPAIPKSSAFYGSGYYFYDLNAKVNYRFSNRDRVYISSYLGKDVFNFNNAKRSFRSKIPWGNATATVRWNHVFHQKLFSNLTLVYNDYNFAFEAGQNDFELKLSSGIRDLNAKLDFDYYPSPQHKLKFGGQFTHHTFIPNVLSGRQGDVVFRPNNENTKYASETALYIQDDWEMSDKVKLNFGLRWSNFSQIGPYTLYTRDVDGNKLDSTVYRRFQTVRQYGGLEPRATLRVAIDDETSLKAAVTRNMQYIHLVSNAGTTLPTDLWVPSTFRVKPQISWLYALGYFKNFRDNMYETSVEVYYKNMENQIEYAEGYTPSLKDPEESFVFGKGWSYGAEFFVNKTRGRLTGWVGYTLSWTWRKFNDLNADDNGVPQKFPAKYDRRHDLSVVTSYELSSRWRLSGIFVYGTGNAFSSPERFYIVNGTLTQEYGRVNSYRLAPYHRLDLAAIYTPKQKKPKRMQSSWSFGIYNVYSRLNPFFIYFDQSGNPFDGSLKIEARQVSLFPIIPSVTWNFKF